MRLLTTHKYSDPFGLFDSIKVIKSPEDVKDGVLILWGGGDIGTSLYEEIPNKFCTNYKPSNRDLEEMYYISQAIENDVPIIGICRGAQLLCVADGGSLYQHVEGHGVSHVVRLLDEGNALIKANSSHHQAMRPDADAKILATAVGAYYAYTEHNKELVLVDPPEVVYFPLINGLGIQPHPEWSNCPQEFIDYCTRKIKEYLL